MLMKPKRCDLRRLQRFVLLALLSVFVLSNVQAKTSPKKARVLGRNIPHRARGVALVVGNSRYPQAPLRNPVNDAKAIGQSLQGLGYQTRVLPNARYRELKKSIAAFSRQLRGAEIGLFYYAGHGIQYKGKNYIIPVDTKIENEQHTTVEGVDMSYVFAKMAAAKTSVNIIILDACRNNPFARSWSSTGTGLAVMDAPAGSLMAYATAPGQVALDGDNLVKNHSVYTAALLEAMSSSDASIEDVFKDVRRRVREATNGKQIPWESTSLEGEVVLKPGGSVRRKTAAFYAAFAKDWPQVDDKMLEMHILGRDAKLAQSICQYLETADRWSCNQDQLNHYPALYVGQHSTAGRLRMTPMRKNPQSCINALVLQISDPDEVVTVNWDLASFIINGAALSARVRLENAGFRVKGTTTRGFKSVSTAPIGSELRAVLSLPDGSCLLPASLKATQKNSAASLVVPFLLGERRNSGKWHIEWRREAVGLAEVLGEIPRPTLSAESPEEPGAAFPYWSVGTGTVGSLVATAFGAVVATSWFPPSTGSDLTPRILGGLGYGACLGACLLLPGLPLAMFIDGRVQAANEDAEKAYVDWQLQKRKQAAYDKIVRGGGGTALGGLVTRPGSDSEGSDRSGQ